jgi:hypothetical protein
VPSSGKARFFSLTAVVLFVLGAGELLGRRAGALMGAVAHRVTFKLALLEARGGADVVVLGSSRGNDCVTPSPIAHALSPAWRGASVATPSSSLPTLEYIAGRAAQTKGLKLALVELSRRQMEPGEVEVDAPPAVDGEDPIGTFLSARSALLKGRRAFAAENWSRLPALVLPSLYDGGEFFHSRWLAESFVFPAQESVTLEPLVAPPLEAPQGAEWERVSQGYRRVVDAFRARGAQVLLYGPPLSAQRRTQECDEQSRRFRASVAQAAGASFDDFACDEVDEAWLTDRDEHCGALGRERFSTVLGERAKEVLIRAP